MSAKYILAVLSAVFLALAARNRLSRSDRRPRAQTRTWLLVGVIFAVVSGWLFLVK